MPAHASFVTLDLCSDPACTTLLTAPIRVEGDSYVPSFDLPPAPTFWRVHALTSGATSITWQVRANARPSAVTAAYGRSFDANADGFSDVTVFRGTADLVPKIFLETYFGGPTGLPQTPSRSMEIPRATPDVVGVTDVGDVNGDGYPDLIFKACSSANDCEYDLHVGGLDGFASTISSRFAVLDESTTIYDVLSEAGDINGDGYADVALGTSNWNGGEGRVLLYFGAEQGLSVAAPQVLVGSTDQSNMLFGASVHPAGDVNADGFDDLTVLIQGSDTVRVLYGGAAGITTATTELPNPFPAPPNLLWGEEDHRGVGDVNGDGYPDIAISYEPDDASMYVLFGGPAGVDSSYARGQIVSRPSGAHAFDGPYLLGDDFDGDGFSDILFADAEIRDGAAQPESTFVAKGSAGVLELSLAFSQGDLLRTARVGHFDGGRYASSVAVASVDASTLLHTYAGGSGGLSTIPSTISATGLVSVVAQ